MTPHDFMDLAFAAVLPSLFGYGHEQEHDAAESAGQGCPTCRRTAERLDDLAFRRGAWWVIR